MSLEELTKDALAELHERWEDGENPHDFIFEIADSMVPVYNSELLALAASDYRLAVVAPDIGPAFDGSPTPINIIAANVFEHIEQALWKAYRNKEDGRE